MVPDMTGLRFGRLTAMSAARDRRGRSMWLCACECGGRKLVLLGGVVDDELQQAARHVVECHAEEVVARFAPKPNTVTLKVVRE
jgi:hypothetical protein